MLSAGPNATQTTIQPLSSGRSYVFQVAAMNDVGVGQPAIGNVSIKQDYTDYLRPQDLVRDSEAVATAPHLSDQQMIEHLRGVGKAFERFSREDLSLTDDQFEMLTANWGKALERLASARPGGAAGVMSRSEVAAALQIQQMLNKGYEYVAGNYNASRPFDFGDLL